MPNCWLSRRPSSSCHRLLSSLFPSTQSSLPASPPSVRRSSRLPSASFPSASLAAAVRCSVGIVLFLTLLCPLPRLPALPRRSSQHHSVGLWDLGCSGRLALLSLSRCFSQHGSFASVSSLFDTTQAVWTMLAAALAAATSVSAERGDDQWKESENRTFLSVECENLPC